MADASRSLSGYAKKNNIDIKQAEANLKLSKHSRLSAQGALLPTITAGASHNYSFGRSVDPFTNEFSEETVQTNDFYIQGAIVLFDGFKKFNQMRQSKYQYMAQEQLIKSTEQKVAIDITAAYMSCLYASEIENIVNQQYELSKKQEIKTSALFENGRVSKSTLLDIRAQMASDFAQLTRARNNMTITKLELAHLLDIDSIESFNIEKRHLSIVLSEFETLTTESAISDINEINPEIKYSEIQIKSAEKEIAVAQGGISPKLTVSLTYSTGYSDARLQPVSIEEMQIGYTQTNIPVYAPYPTYGEYGFSEQLRDNANTYLSLRLTIPIFNGFNNYTKIKSSKVNLLTKQYELEQTQKHIQKTVTQACTDISVAKNNLIATQKSVDAAQESFNFAQQKFDKGISNAIEYNSAKNNLIKAQSELLRAKYDLSFKAKVLDLYLGK